MSLAPWLRSALLPSVAGLLAIGIFIFDTFSPLQFAVAVLYVVVVLIAATRYQRRGVLIAASGCAALTVLSLASLKSCEFALALSRPRARRVLLRVHRAARNRWFADLYGAFPVKRLLWVLLTVLCSERERPFFIPSPAIQFAERAEGVKGPKR